MPLFAPPPLSLEAFCSFFPTFLSGLGGVRCFVLRRAARSLEENSLSWPFGAFLGMPPRISASFLTGQEAEEADHLDILLSALDGYVRNFADALGLFDFSLAESEDRENPLGRWMFIAARDAGVTIYHFGVILDAIHKRIDTCLTLVPQLDRQALSRAAEAFAHRFPTQEAARNAISHAAELIESPPELRRNISGNLFVRNSLLGRKLTMTHRGKLLEVDISDVSLDHLTEILNLVFAAFRPIEAANAARRGSV